MEEVTPPLRELAVACWGKVLTALRKHGLDKADMVSRACVLEVLREVRSARIELYRVVETLTGGLGYSSGEPFEPAQMVVAGTVIAWPEAVRDGSRVLEIGTGIGRTCYVVHYASKPSLYVTVDFSPEVLAVALYMNPSTSFSRCLESPTVKLILADAVEAVKLLPSSFFDHVVHDGGPNPLRNPRLYTPSFMKQLYRVMKPCSTISVFAGRSRRGRELVYRSLKEAGFTGIEAVAFPSAPTTVYRARKPCTDNKA